MRETRGREEERGRENKCRDPRGRDPRVRDLRDRDQVRVGATIEPLPRDCAAAPPTRSCPARARTGGPDARTLRVSLRPCAQCSAPAQRRTDIPVTQTRDDHRMMPAGAAGGDAGFCTESLVLCPSAKRATRMLRVTRMAPAQGPGCPCPPGRVSGRVGPDWAIFQVGSVF